jgi:hypothetical protein
VDYQRRFVGISVCFKSINAENHVVICSRGRFYEQSFQYIIAWKDKFNENELHGCAAVRYSSKSGLSALAEVIRWHGVVLQSTCSVLRACHP